MRVITAYNVNEAYDIGWHFIHEFGKVEETRNGPALVAPTPVTTRYIDSRQRVLFDRRRKANPFFHLAESLWMLAGYMDARWLDFYVKDFSERYAEADGNQHGAYGYRWKKHFEVNQVRKVIELLKANRGTRQAVIGMWDPTADLNDLPLKDRPCNTHIYFRVQGDQLEMTVCCRSNDMVYGAYGANAVHFSILQEHIAHFAGLRVGAYYQISNNFHFYTKMYGIDGTAPYDPYQIGLCKPSPLHGEEDYLTWTGELQTWCTHRNPEQVSHFKSSFLRNTVAPMHAAWAAHKAKDRVLALKLAEKVEASDWRLAAQQWLGEKYSEKLS